MIPAFYLNLLSVCLAMPQAPTTPPPAQPVPQPPTVVSSAPPALVEGVNSFFKSNIIPQINPAIPEQVQDLGLDNIEQVTSGGKSTRRTNIGVCKVGASYNYAVTDLVGVQNVQIAALNVNSADILSDGKFSLKLSGNTNDFDLSARFVGSARVVCGKLKPRVGISGTLSLKSSSLSLAGSTDTSIDINGGQVTIAAVNISDPIFKMNNVDIHINRVAAPFDKLIDEIGTAIANDFKDKIQTQVNKQVGEMMNDIVQNKLSKVIPAVIKI